MLLVQVSLVLLTTLRDSEQRGLWWWDLSDQDTVTWLLGHGENTPQPSRDRGIRHSSCWSGEGPLGRCLAGL